MMKPLPILIVLVAAAALVWFVVDQPTGPSQQETPDDNGADPAVEPGPKSGAGLHTNGSGQPAAESEKAKAGKKADPASLEVLWKQAPTGKAEEWDAARLGQSGVAVSNSSRVASLLDAMAGGQWMNEPPYRLSLVFGESDLPWLEKLGKLYDQEIGVGDGIDGADMAAIIEQREVYYRQVLEDVAKRRVVGHPELALRFDDGAVLRDVREASHRAWLDAVIGLVEANTLWGSAPLIAVSVSCSLRATLADSLPKRSGDCRDDLRRRPVPEALAGSIVE